MYTELSRRTVVTFAKTEEVTRPFSMANANGILGDVTCVVFSAAGVTNPKLTVTVEQSNDGDNWEDISESDPTKTVEFTDVGYSTLQIDQIAAAWIRMRFTFTSGTGIAATIVVAAGVETADL